MDGSTDSVGYGDGPADGSIVGTGYGDGSADTVGYGDGPADGSIDGTGYGDGPADGSTDGADEKKSTSKAEGGRDKVGERMICVSTAVAVDGDLLLHSCDIHPTSRAR